METGGIENELDHLSKVIRENEKIREEHTATMIEVARQVKSEIAEIARCLNCRGRSGATGRP